MCNDYPDAPASAIAFIIPLHASVRAATSVRRGSTARTIDRGPHHKIPGVMPPPLNDGVLRANN